MTHLWQFLRDALRRQRSSAEGDDVNAKASAKKYWRAKVEEEREHDLPKTTETQAERKANESAERYWQREVSEEKKRRGTPDKPKR